MWCGRTTHHVDLPDHLHRLATAIARDSGTTSSETISRLLSGALEEPGPVQVSTSAVTGLRVVTTGTPVASEDVGSLDDDE